MQRRTFLKTALGATLATSMFGRVRAAETPWRATDRLTLGPRRIDCCRMFLGTGTIGRDHSSNQTRDMGFDGLVSYLRQAYDEGFTSWDSADLYGSHGHIAQAIKDGVPRDKVTILSKSFAREAGQMRSDIERIRKELNTDVIDIFLFHCLQDADWRTTMRPVMDLIDEYQEKGVIRSKGVSCHSIEALRAAAEEPWVEIDLARINPKGVIMDAEPAVVVPVLEKMKAAGKGVIGMKILGEGQLVNEADACLEYALNLPCVDAMTIGCESTAQRLDMAARIARTPRRAV